MGLFGGKQTFVSSTLYNLAGDVGSRPQYMRDLLISTVLTQPRLDMAKLFDSGFIKGPAMNLRAFFRWARVNYGLIGTPTGTLVRTSNITDTTLANRIPHGSGETVVLQTAEVGLADYSYWAEQWMLENHQDKIDTDWESDVDSLDTMRVIVRLADGTLYDFVPAGYQEDARYIYASYSIRTGSVDPVTGEPTDDGANAPLKMFIYRIGSGDAQLDAFAGNYVPTSAEYIPFIPLRLNNKFLSEEYLPDAYKLAKKAYKKVSGGRKLDDMIKTVEDNESLADIDYAYLMWGVSLNAPDTSAKEYLFRYFDLLRQNQDGNTVSRYNDWITKANQYAPQFEAWEKWQEAQQDPDDPAYGDPEPKYPKLPPRPTQMVQIKADGIVPSNVDMRVIWSKITDSSGQGLYKPGMKKDSFILEQQPNTVPVSGAVYADGKKLPVSSVPNSIFRIVWQKTATSWQALEVTGAAHENRIYNGKSVVIGAEEALEDDDESGFLVPLHYETFKSMSLVAATQMQTACSYIVFNSYKVVKQKWYETIAFKIFVFAAIIAVSAATGGAGAVGILGTAGSVGAAAGFTGVVAILAGSIINAVVATLVLKIVQEGSTALFGDKLGSIIGSVVAVAAMAVGPQLASGSSLTTAWGSLMSAQNIMSMTDAAGKGIAGYLQQSAIDVGMKTAKLVLDAQKESKRLMNEFQDEMGIPLGLDFVALNEARGQADVIESIDSFTSRTLLVGSEIAELTLDMITNFAEYNTSISLPGGSFTGG